MQQAFPFQGFLLAVDPAQGVHQQGSAEQVEPSQPRRAEGIHETDGQIHASDRSQELADLVQVPDPGINDGEQVMTATILTGSDARGISFETDGKAVMDITKYTLFEEE